MRSAKFSHKESPSSISLPQEIIDLIIDLGVADIEYGPEFKPFLAACSLVSRSFHTRSRVHLFRDVNITLDSKVQKRAKKALDILNQNKDLVLLHVHRFCLVIDFQEVRWKKADTPGWKRRVVGWANYFRRNSFMDLLHLLAQAQLRDVVVKGKDSRNPGDWNQIMTTQTSSFILSMCSKDTLRFVCFRSLRNLPCQVFRAGSSSSCLQEYLVRNVVVQGVETAALNDSSSTLKTLELTHAKDPTTIFSMMSSQLSLSGVTSMTISTPNHPDQVAPFWKILQSLKSLETLNLNITSGNLPRTELTDTIRLDQLCKLQSLKFTVASEGFPGCFNDGLGGVLIFVQSPSSPLPHLRSFELCVHSKIPDDEGLILAFLLGDFLPNQWRALDQALMGGGHFPGLQEVKIWLKFSAARIVMLGVYEEREMAERKAMVTRDMRLLAGAGHAGLITFEVHTPWTPDFDDPFI